MAKVNISKYHKEVKSSTLCVQENVGNLTAMVDKFGKQLGEEFRDLSKKNVMKKEEWDFPWNQPNNIESKKKRGFIQIPLR